MNSLHQAARSLIQERVILRCAPAPDSFAARQRRMIVPVALVNAQRHDTAVRIALLIRERHLEIDWTNLESNVPENRMDIGFWAFRNALVSVVLRRRGLEAGAGQVLEQNIEPGAEQVLPALG